MLVIEERHKSGKTTELIHKSSVSRAVIVCNGKKECSNIVRFAKRHSIDIPPPITYSEFLKRQTGNASGYYIDDLDIFLRKLSAIPVLAVTLTKEKSGG